MLESGESGKFDIDAEGEDGEEGWEAEEVEAKDLRRR